MAASFLLEINLPLLTQHLEEAEKRLWKDDEVTAFLEDCGFVRAGERWIAEEVSLEVLSKTEYRIVEDIVD